VPQVMAQFVLKIELLSHIMGTTPILEMARAYGLRPRLWLLYKHISQILTGLHFCGRWMTVVKAVKEFSHIKPRLASRRTRVTLSIIPVNKTKKTQWSISLAIAREQAPGEDGKKFQQARNRRIRRVKRSGRGQGAHREPVRRLLWL